MHVALQQGRDLVAKTPGDCELSVEITIDVRAGRFGGPFVHGRNGDRFVYLSWGEADGEEFRMFRRAKLRLEHLDAEALDGLAVEARLPLRDRKGHPICASLRPPQVVWRVLS